LKTQTPQSLPFQLAPRGTASPLTPGGATAPYRGVDILDPLGRTRPVPLKPAATVQVKRAPKTPQQINHIYELGLTSIAMSFHQAAVENMREVTELAPDHAGAWTTLAELLRLSGLDDEAREAEAKAASIDVKATAWRDATGETAPARLESIERKVRADCQKVGEKEMITQLRGILFEDPLNVAAMRFLANEEDLAEDPTTAMNLLARALKLSPNYLAARADYARLLMSERQHLLALEQSAYLIAAEPTNNGYRLLRADASVQAEKFEEARIAFEAILADEPNNEHVLNAYGSLLKTLGRREDAVKTFRKLLSIAPGRGGAYFGLSELKANYLNPVDVVAMHRYLTEGIEDLGSRKCMAYALGQTLERGKEYEGSFEAYAYGAKTCKAEIAGTLRVYEPDRFQERLERLRQVFTAESMARQSVAADPAVVTTPIFVLGMPRAGSTLVEQILGSHPMVEPTRELPVVAQLSRKVGMSRVIKNPDIYPARVAELSRPELDALGQELLARIAPYRTTSLPYVIDKRPWNWLDIPFIHLILPQARFIDIRRAPMAAGFAMFKQLLPADAAFSFDLQHLGHYYRQYVQQMAYLDTILPGKILRVSYEDLVQNTEPEIRRMLEYCGLPFEEKCLRFWESDRAVLTPSAEQVRRPIFTDALTQWKNFEPWLGPLKESLGDLAEA
jgi:tetratricopeptide (TPR) repeat protein